MAALSVIVPVWQEEEFIGPCLRDLERSVEPLEVIVVDGGSTDRTLQIARGFPGVRVESALRGRARQMNHGARRASGDILWFLHCDSRVPPAAASIVRRALARPAVIGGSFRFAIAAEGFGYRIMEAGAHIRTRLFGAPLGDQSLFVRRSVFERLGGYPDVPILEDLLLWRRMRRAGKVVIAGAPLATSARRWQRCGLARTMLANWAIMARAALGASFEELARIYDRPAASQRLASDPGKPSIHECPCSGRMAVVPDQCGFASTVMHPAKAAKAARFDHSPEPR